MKKSHKQHIRAFILELLYDKDIRCRMSEFLDRVKKSTGEKIDDFEAMEFYEQEVQRINKYFYYPESIFSSEECSEEYYEYFALPASAMSNHRS